MAIMSATKSGPLKEQKIKKMKPKDKNKPKRCGNAFAFYVKEQMTGSTEFSGEGMRRASESWKNLNAKEKKKFENMAVKDKKRYKSEMDKYNSTKVKKPANAYMLFVKKFMKSRPDNQSFIDAAAAASKQWNRMSEEEKGPFVRDAQKAKCKYELAKKALESKLAKLAKTSTTAKKMSKKMSSATKGRNIKAKATKAKVMKAKATKAKATKAKKSASKAKQTKSPKSTKAGTFQKLKTIRKSGAKPRGKH